MTPTHQSAHQSAQASQPRVGIIMGSDSDLPVMQAAADLLAEFAIPFELTIVSAHRTPRRLFDYATSASQRGLEVIIAGAGGAAHLPGMTAAMTPLPVIGVPVKTSALSGQDSLLSIVQMPAGVPVATVAINGARNAGLLAAKMLGIADRGIRAQLEHFAERMEQQVLAKAAALEAGGNTSTHSPSG
ncbi:5-(carboxyamino)imidazole ribonucleotide mutase [Thiorhodovibrio frisius]|uniref:N5-carboxyaminoimidazole ribonucleotide mutase n=1 Tax=Thiorhodovibrio frisius TaxID=631362 RepID=H8YWP4_9GAMM|nr:5-(carboxyamino)imidazole ribonucleotide mutase [Thiorhodovibrio frisius]EIC22870.1 phosphoribosylaminoimidazole carboxylase, PurE protein [Thiorhodovibrio frisius]WPL22872.1 N5-carboxyaminoimidazole ribonucleotide mutase [Thiorhodovibrio frisius]